MRVVLFSAFGVVDGQRVWTNKKEVGWFDAKCMTVLVCLRLGRGLE